MERNYKVIGPQDHPMAGYRSYIKHEWGEWGAYGFSMYMFPDRSDKIKNIKSVIERHKEHIEDVKRDLKWWEEYLKAEKAAHVQ